MISIIRNIKNEFTSGGDIITKICFATLILCFIALIGILVFLVVMTILGKSVGSSGGHSIVYIGGHPYFF